MKPVSHAILSKLEGGDRRSIGKSNAVVAEVLAKPSLFDAVFSGLSADCPVMRARCADAVEKITLSHPEWLRPYRKALLARIAPIEQKEVRWHVAQMLPRLRWSAPAQGRVLAVLEAYLGDTSSIVRTFALQALADLAAQAPALRPAALSHLRRAMSEGTPAMKARARRLHARLGR